MKTKTDPAQQLTTREALHIYSSCLTKETFGSEDFEVIKIRDSYRLGLSGFQKHIEKAVSLNTPKINTANPWSQIVDENFIKLIRIAKSDLIEQRHIEWIYNLKRYELFYLNHVIEKTISYSNPAISNNFSPGDFSKNIYNLSYILKALSPTSHDDEKGFLLYKLLFLIDNCVNGDKINRSHHLESYRKQLHIFGRTAPWFLKNIELFGTVFEKWLQKYLNEKNASKQLSTPNYSNTWEMSSYDLDYWLFEFTKSYDVNTSDSELFFRDMKSAWSQKKYRDSNNGKKACSFQLDERDINLLDKLCRLHRRNKNEMIEILIEDACEEDGIIKRPERR